MKLINDMQYCPHICDLILLQWKQDVIGTCHVKIKFAI